MSRIRRGGRAQAAVETALILPVLVFMMLGAADLGRAFYLKLEMSGASRAGLRQAVLGQTVDVGNAVRTEPNSAIPAKGAAGYAAWGKMAAGVDGGSYGDCTSTTTSCGDPGGCASTSTTGWIAGQQACFAVRTCIVWNSGSCTTFSSWGVRPSAGADEPVDVLVVYRFIPATPIITNFAGSTGAFYLGSETLGLQLY